MKLQRYLIIVMLSLCYPGFTQQINPEILTKKWEASWICVPGQSETGYGVYKFCKEITLAEKPSSFIVHVSADNRYKLWVNGVLASLGPARGDLFHWNFETVDLSPHLQPGKNIISAVVWNFGAARPEAQQSIRTAFIVQGNTATEHLVNTDSSWRSIRDDSYTPRKHDIRYTYYVSGPGENIDFHKHITGFTSPAFNDSAWAPAQMIFHGVPKGVFDWSTGWMLVPRSIPPMEMTVERLKTIRKSDGITLPKAFPATRSPFTVPAHKKITLWLDHGHLTNAYPVLQFSHGKEATITLSYAESLYQYNDAPDWQAHKEKGNRHETEGKRFLGVSDQLISNGLDRQTFTPLWWRTYRYLQLEIETKNEALRIDDLHGIFTGYPFQMKAAFQTNLPVLKEVYEVGWRTARLCAAETYMDCPYYEQLQYVGDTRIQALVSLFNSGDDRLVRQAIVQLDYSRMAEGITLSRYPTAHPQEIPTFSLWWIGMVYDYWMYRDDEEFVKSMLPGVRQVLHFFSQYQENNTGLLRHVPYWPFTDWAEGKGWRNGIAPMSTDGYASTLDLQLCWAYALAGNLEKALGRREQAEDYWLRSANLKTQIRQRYWDESKKLFADTPEKSSFSQHANTLAILAKVCKDDEAPALLEKTLSDTSLTQATIYFKYYVHRAVVQTGQGNRYLDLLGDWYEQLRQGLTTWAEISDVNHARSDCHAWGSSPNIEFFRIVLGIDSHAPGFKEIKIEPHLGKLTEAYGTMPHPRGEISVRYTQRKGKWSMQITIPKDTRGIFRWKGKDHVLNDGIVNTFTL